MPILGSIIVPHPPLIIPAVGRGDESRPLNSHRSDMGASPWQRVQIKVGSLMVVPPDKEVAARGVTPRAALWV